MMRVILFCAICVCFGLGGVLLTACEQVAETGGARCTSPQAVWDAYRYAVHRGRWKEAFQCLTPEARERQVHGLVFTAAHLGHTPEKATADKLKAILKKHGLDVDHIEAETAGTEREDASDYLREMNRRVHDAEGLFVEAMSVLDPVLPRPAGKYWRRVLAHGELTGIDIVDSRATGKYIRKLNEGELFSIGGVRQTEVEHTAVFHESDGRWFVHEEG